MHEKTLLFGALAATALAAGFGVYKAREAPPSFAITPVAKLDETRSTRPIEIPVRLTASDGTGLRLASIRGSAAIEDPLALTELHLVFENPQDRGLEGTFSIALPHRASVSRFAMKVGETWQEGEVVEKQEARAAYEDFLHQLQDPALLEHSAGNEFSARVFPIPARGTKEIIVAYAETLEAGAPYVLPLKGLPALSAIDIDVHASGTSTRNGTFGLHQRSFAPAEDFVVAASALPRSAGLRSNELVVARVVPFATSRPDPLESAVVLVDSSASRALGFEEQANLVRRMFAKMRPDARVTVACFDQEVVPVYQGPIGGFGDEVVAAIVQRGALGASDLQQALAWAGAEARRKDLHRVVVIGDGVATAGETDVLRLRLEIEKLRAAKIERIDAIAIGGIRDDAFLRAIVRGVLDRDGAVLDASIGSEGLARRLDEATSSGIAVQVDGAKWSWPKTLDGLQAGDEVIVHAEVPADVPVRIDVGGQQFNPDLRSAPRPLVERSWAQAKIQSLLEAPAADPATTKRDIVALGTKHRVVSPHTAMLVLETDADYARFGIDRRANRDVLSVRDGRIAVLQSPPTPAAPQVAATATAAVDSKARDVPANEPGKKRAEQGAFPEPLPTEAPPRPPTLPAPPVAASASSPSSPVGAASDPYSSRSGQGAPTATPAVPATGSFESPVIIPPATATVQVEKRPPAPVPTPAPAAPTMAPKSEAKNDRPSPPSHRPRQTAPAPKPKPSPGKAATDDDEQLRAALEELLKAQADDDGDESPSAPKLTTKTRPSQQPPSDPSTTPIGVVRQGEVVVHHGLSGREAERVLASALPQLRACYTLGRHDDPSLHGDLRVRVVVGASGVVEQVFDAHGTTSSLGASVQGCAIAVVRGLRFPSPAATDGSARAELRATFHFVPSGATDRTSPSVAEDAPAAAPYEGRFKTVMELLARGEKDAALDEARRWRAELPGDVMALVALGEALEAKGDVRTAARAYGSIAELYSFRADSRRFAGERLERLADPAALRLAIDTYAKAVAARPDHPSGHRLHAFALLKHGEHEKAFAALRTAAMRSYPPGRFLGVDRILREDLGLVAAAWTRAEPRRAREIQDALRAVGGHEETEPSLRFVLVWETDANDVDLHIHDARGGHAFYSQKELASGGALYADVTTGYGPECFNVRAPRDRRAYPYRLRANYYSRGPMGYGMGKLELIDHDGKGNLAFEERPFVVMADDTFVDLGTVDPRARPQASAMK